MNTPKLLYFPGVLEQKLADKIIHLMRGVQQDIGRCLRYQNQYNDDASGSSKNNRIQVLIKRNRKRAIERLEELVNMQSIYQKDSEEWEDILKKALKKSHPNMAEKEFSDKYRELITIFRDDLTRSRIHYVQSVMELIGKIPKNQVNTPFKQ